MQNEILLILSLILTYTIVIVLFRLFQEQGLYLWTIVATIAANIEVLILVNAFGMEMTLGNILFASTFLVTDILSELYGKKQAQTAVWMGIATSITFILDALCSQRKRLCLSRHPHRIFQHTKADAGRNRRICGSPVI